jgi:hypothetical protein
MLGRYTPYFWGVTLEARRLTPPRKSGGFKGFPLKEARSPLLLPSGPTSLRSPPPSGHLASGSLSPPTLWFWGLLDARRPETPCSLATGPLSTFS